MNIFDIRKLMRTKVEQKLMHFNMIQEISFKPCVPLDFTQSMIVCTVMYRINFMSLYDSV